MHSKSQLPVSKALQLYDRDKVSFHSFTGVLPFLELTNYNTFAGVIDRAVNVTLPFPLPFGKLRENVSYVRFCAG